MFVYVISSREPLGVRPSVVRRRRRSLPFPKILLSETAWPIKAKFYMKHLLEGGTNVFINNPGHMTTVAATPIYILIFTYFNRWTDFNEAWRVASGFSV